MARGSLRAPSQTAYRGAAGATRQAAIHVTLPSGDVASVPVYTAIDVTADPELGQRLLGEGLNVLRLADGSALPIAAPVVYHDPSNELMVLVLAESDRHRELTERARLLHELAADPATPVPRYAREFVVVFGARGLRAFLEQAAEKAVAAARAADAERERDAERAAAERRRAEVAANTAELERIRQDLERKAREQERKAAELDLLRADLERERLESTRLRAEIELLRADLDRARRAPARSDSDEASTGPFALSASADEVDTANQAALPVHDAHRRPTTARPVTASGQGGQGGQGGPSGQGGQGGQGGQLGQGGPLGPDEPTEIASPPTELPAGSDPLMCVTADLPGGPPDAWLETFASGNAVAAIAADEAAGAARLALRVPPGAAAALSRGPLDVRLQLHRTAAYPVVTITVGVPMSLRVGAQRSSAASATLDVAADVDKKALAVLARRFVLTVELIADGRRVRRATLTAPLEENVAYVVRAAQDHLRTLTAEASSGAQPSYPRGRAMIADPGYDLLGAEHPEAGEFRDDKLGQLATANQVRRALAIARRFTRPSREDYLVTVRGFALPRWHERRRAVLARAVEWGLWMGPELAQVAVSEGLARSKKDLLARLEPAFTTMLGDVAINDLDGDAAEDNRKALAEEARAAGVSRGDPARPVASADGEVVASGTIERGRAATVDPRGKPIEELLALLDDRQARVAAALELCERGDARGIRPVLHAVRRMGRAEAVRVLGAMVKFGEAAAPALTAGLGSSKAFLRHGCALALGMLRTEAGTEAVIDLLLSEPTEIWRELARGVGQVGPSALMPLAARMGRLGERATPATRERVAWAMAHVGVRGGRAAVEQLSGGHSVVAPVARQALELMAPAARDDLRGTGPGREVTVNRAFSRRFFEALGSSGRTELDALDASGPMELLDEADLIEDADDDGADELDDADLEEVEGRGP